MKFASNMEKKKSKLTSWIRAIVLVISIVIIFPFWLKMGKDKVYEKDGIKIYASKEINPTDVENVADSALVLLKSHGIVLKGSTSIIFYDTREEFKWRNLFISSDALAMNWWPFTYITFAPADLGGNRLYARKGSFNQRPISSVIAHELTHTYQAEQLNIIGYKYNTFRHKWKTEGMAELVSESGSLPLQQGLELFMREAGKDELSALDISGEYFYFKSHVKADYLLNYKQLTEAEFWSNNYDDSALETEIRTAISEGSYAPHWRE